jgi:hypothetical protein
MLLIKYLNLEMISRTSTMALLFALTTVTVSMAYASNQPQISLINAGNSEIDLAWEEKDRMVRTWTQFSNFNPNDGSFIMQIAQSETGKIVSESTINVMTNSQNASINFNTFVLYAVNAEDICQNDEFDAEIMSLEECNPLTGQYEIMISTNDGTVVSSIPFTVIYTRT